MTVARLLALDTSLYEAKSWLERSGWSARVNPLPVPSFIRRLRLGRMPTGG